MQEPSQQKGNFEKELVNVHFNNFIVTTTNMHENIALIVMFMCDNHGIDFESRLFREVNIWVGRSSRVPISLSRF